METISVEGASSKATETVFEELAPPLHATEALERWNSNRTNMLRFFVTLLSFLVLGANDAAFGAIIPYVSTNVNTSTLADLLSWKHITIYRILSFVSTKPQLPCHHTHCSSTHLPRSFSGLHYGSTSEQ